MENQKESKPDRLSPEWHEYVMGFFENHELIDGNPTTAGLRRVAEKLIGPIVSSRPVSVTHDGSASSVGRATVVYEVEFQLPKPNGTITYGDVAEVWEGNTDDLFAVHAAATASTRAEGRALRKALKVRALAAEELCKKDVSKYVAENDVSRISKDQVNFIDLKCKKLDIDVMGFVNSGSKKYRSVYEVTRETAAKMIKEINKFSNDENLIKEEFKNYKDDWNQ